MIRRRIFRFIFYSSIPVAVFGVFCHFAIEESAERFLFDEPSGLPSCKTAIVLGTARYLKSGEENLYFTYRMNAAEKLFNAGKVKYFILSGDNRTLEYNEPKAMKAALMQKGIPDSCLFLDYAGLRTFDSMVRCKEIFGQDSVIVVSQRFHNVRAVFIGKKNGLAAFGFNAQKVTTQKNVKMKFREFFSRIKCVLDIYVLGTESRHLGDKIKI